MDFIILKEFAPFFIYGNSLRDAIDQLFSFIIQISEKKKELLLELRESKRFSNLLLSGYRNELDDLENPGQFSADMIQISDFLYFISYSGTDGTIIGRKKSFQFSYIFRRKILAIYNN